MIGGAKKCRDVCDPLQDVNKLTGNRLTGSAVHKHFGCYIFTFNFGGNMM
jgi:hypothetical protein